MTRTVYNYDKKGTALLSTDEATPVCGDDFCDKCGDCLRCYGDDPCWPDGGSHWWVKYGDDAAEAE